MKKSDLVELLNSYPDDMEVYIVPENSSYIHNIKYISKKNLELDKEVLIIKTVQE